jgi:hypothetical protein
MIIPSWHCGEASRARPTEKGACRRFSFVNWENGYDRLDARFRRRRELPPFISFVLPAWAALIGIGAMPSFWAAVVLKLGDVVGTISTWL